MRDNEMVRAAERWFEVEEEVNSLDRKIAVLKSEREDCLAEQEQIGESLSACVGANISERFIPVGDRMIILKHEKPMRVSDRVVLFQADQV